MVYGVFSGQYSNWEIHGYFEDKISAQKYCAKKNLHEHNNEGVDEDGYSYDAYYVVDIPNLINNNYDASDVKLRYYHTVVFDLGTGMRQEPDRYVYYTGVIKVPSAKYNLYTQDTKETGWVSFSFDCENRERAEKIAQDKYAMFMNSYHESGSYKLAAETMGIKKLYEK